jgi:hypothetical protein
MRPLLALIGHRDGVEECPLLGVERTSQFDRAMFAVDPKRTSEPATGMPYKKTFCVALTRRCRSACEFQPIKLLMLQSTKADQNPLEISAEGGLDARFCEVMDAAPVMMWVSGKDKGCVWFNKSWLNSPAAAWSMRSERAGQKECIATILNAA